jgi:predicted O-linked N-acetylglucosamine transferase (SPINDLY family)
VAAPPRRKCCREVLRAEPDNFEALYLLGVAAILAKDPAAAASLLARAARACPTSAEAHYGLGIALMQRKQFVEALCSYDQALACWPDYAVAHYNRALVLKSLNRLEDALASLDAAVQLRPAFAQAHNEHGIALYALSRSRAAFESYGRAIQSKPDFADAYNNRGLALALLKQFFEALADFDKAIAIDPTKAGYYSNRGSTLVLLKRYEEAITDYTRALSLDSDTSFVEGALLDTKLLICDWRSVTQDIVALAAKIERGEPATPSFPVLAFTDSLSLQHKAAKIWVREKHPENAELGPIPKRPRAAKICIGYFSADFHNHATMALMAEMFERHDKKEFELIAFSFGPDIKDDMRARAVSAFDRFEDVCDKSDKEVAALARALGIDIAVDLKGFTGDSRPGIFAFRAAPVQAQYIGYPGTMGADYIDYIIADHTLIPAKDRFHYSEKVAYLPDSYQANDTRRIPRAKPFTRAELGLPAGFVFCCFNNSYKIAQHIFGRWMNILAQTPGSILWLFDSNPSATANLRKEAAARGIYAGRLIFAPSMPRPDHLARVSVADLCLDTQPYGAHTTASDALWSGVPVLTCAGRAFADRVAASLLNAVEMPELIAGSLDEYEAAAIDLALHPQKLDALKQKLACKRITAPLFDTSRFTRNIEHAYEQMIARYQADMPPDHIIICGRKDS